MMTRGWPHVAAWRRLAVGIVLTFGVAGAATACAVEVSPAKSSCSPSYKANTEYGDFSAQQSGSGAGIQWGMYPNYPATRYVTDVYVGSTRFDHKDQNYPPHGSVPASAVQGKAGQDFTVTGVVYDSGNNTLNFTLKCVIA